ncbi:MAG: hypothetical protein H6822_23535 [Planctomycetaceae bacterium]|nr:hypothetical protein [Planctomycetales bacterium]MCB9925172.1 hypothetical protein [Planctomycetaceae bacterium]
MELQHKATSLWSNFFMLGTPQIRVFHMTWFSFSLRFFAWFGKGRVFWLFTAVFCEGLALMMFSQMAVLLLAIPALILFSWFVQMSEGATFSVVPFINKKELGAVAGIVGAGGHTGAVAAGFLFKSALDWQTVLLILGAVVVVCSFAALLVRFSPEAESESSKADQTALSQNRPQVEPQLEPALT